MAVNISQFLFGATKVAFYGAVVGGYANGTSAVALPNGTAQGMGRLKGFQTASVGKPAASAVAVLGDGGVIGGFMAQPQEIKGGDAAVAVVDHNFKALAEGYKVYVDGDYDIMGDTVSCAEYRPLMLVINTPALSQEAGTVGQSGWAVAEYWNVRAQVTGPAEYNGQEAGYVGQYTATMTMFATDVEPCGRAVTVANYGKRELDSVLYWSPNPVTYHAFRGNGTTTAITLDEKPAEANGLKVQVWIDGIAQSYTTNYTVDVTTKVVTFVSAPSNGARVVVRYQFVYAC